MFEIIKKWWHGGKDEDEALLRTEEQKRTYWRYVRKQFNKNRRAVFSLYVLYFLLFVFVFADFLANDKPIVAQYNERVTFPVINEYLVGLGVKQWPADMVNVEWKELDYGWTVWPLIPYGPTEDDSPNPRVGPGGGDVPSFRWQHWLGTNGRGEDVLSTMIHATRIDLSIGVIAMFFATLIGVFFGALAGFFGDDRLKSSRASIIMLLLFIYPAFFYGFQSRAYLITDSLGDSIWLMIGELALSFLIFFSILGLAYLLSRPLKKIPWFEKEVSLPLDILVSRIIEVVISVPVLFLIILVVSLVEGGSIFWVMVVIGLTRWTGIARFIRAELLRIRNLEYIEAARALGYSQRRMIIKHAIPNALAPVLITVAFGIASAILIESFLAFIGIGVPLGTPTWGALLEEGRQSLNSWWLALFPGLAIFVTVTIFNLIGEGLTDALDPRQKQ